jgi:hypothetical protein
MRLAAFVLIGSAVLAQDTDSALEQIRAAEGNLRNAQFTMESRVFERSPSGNLLPSEQFSDVEGLVVPGPRARYHVKLHAGLPAVVKRDGKIEMSTVQRRHEITFDGTTQAVIEYALDSFDSPTRTRVNTPSSWQGERGFIALFSNRLTHVVPLYEGIGLSTYLATIPDEAPDWKVLPSEDADHLTIWFPRANYVPDGLQDQMSYVVTLDLARGGNIVDWKWYLDYKDGQGQLMAALEDVKLEQVDGVWLPVAFVQRNYNYDPTTGEDLILEETNTKLTWSHVNAELGPDAFRMEIPEGVRVRDDRYHSLMILVAPEDWTVSQIQEFSESIADYRQAVHTEMGKTRCCCRFVIPARAWAQVIDGIRAEGVEVDTGKWPEKTDAIFLAQKSFPEHPGGDPHLLDWWTPGTADNPQRWAWYQHKLQTPKKWVMAQASPTDDEHLLVYIYVNTD